MRGPKYRVTVFPYRESYACGVGESEWIIEYVEPDRICTVQRGAARSEESAVIQARLWIDHKKRDQDARSRRQREARVFEVSA